MAKVAHAMSKIRNRNHAPLMSQLRTLDRKRPLKLSVPPLESVLAHEFILTPRRPAASHAHSSTSDYNIDEAFAALCEISADRRPTAAARSPSREKIPSFTTALPSAPAWPSRPWGRVSVRLRSGANARGKNRLAA